MKKILSLLLAVMMLFACASAMAQEEEPVNLKLSFSAAVNGNVLAQLLPAFAGTELNDNTRQIIDAALKVFNKLRVEAALDAKESKGGLDLKLNEQSIAAFAGRLQEGKLQIISSLYPSYMVTADESYLAEAFGQLQQAGGENSAADALNALGESLAGITPELEPIIDQPVKGDYVIEGAPFDTCTPAHLPLSQLAKVMDQVLAALEQNEEAQQFLQGTDIAEMRESLAEVIAGEKGAETLDFMVYTCEDGAEAAGDNVYFTTEIAPEGDEMCLSLAAGQVNGTLSAHVLFGAKTLQTEEALRAAAAAGQNAAAVDLRCEFGEDTLTFTLDAVITGVTLGLNAKLGPSDDGQGLKATTDLYLFTKQEPLLTLNALLLPGQGLVKADFDEARLQAVDAKELSENEELQKLFFKDVQENGLNGLLAAAQAAMPDEVNALLNLLAPPQPAPEAVTE